jgi:hypothetical protein
MSGGMLTKQAVLLSAKYLNDVNDAVSGGAPVSVPSGVPTISSSQTIPGDKIVLDDATALGLSDTAIGTLYGGVYMYVGNTSNGNSVRGKIAFFQAADIGGSTSVYRVSTVANPSTSVPSYIAGIFINAITASQYGWIQVAGALSVLFDSTALTAVAAGNWVTAKISAATAGTADVGAAAGVVTIAALIGVAVGLPTSAVVSTVMCTRGLFMGRI